VDANPCLNPLEILEDPVLYHVETNNISLNKFSLNDQNFPTINNNNNNASHSAASVNLTNSNNMTDPANLRIIETRIDANDIINQIEIELSKLL
jgi:hypothetical protein